MQQGVHKFYENLQATPKFSAREWWNRATNIRRHRTNLFARDFAALTYSIVKYVTESMKTDFWDKSVCKSNAVWFLESGIQLEKTKGSTGFHMGQVECLTRSWSVFCWIISFHCCYFHSHTNPLPFHYYHCVNIHSDWLREQFCNFSFHVLYILSVQ
jgi:hypothetical protein